MNRITGQKKKLVIKMEPNQLYKLVTDLREIMEKDGKITSEETTIIASVTKSIEQFTSAYNKALDDNIITQEQTTNLAILWDKIYDDSYSAAM